MLKRSNPMFHADAGRWQAMDALRSMAVLIDMPWLALIPAVFFVLLFLASGSKLALATGVFWIVYSFYEYGMKYRFMCTGECNIRIDLLLLYPSLLAASLGGFVSFLISMRRRIRA